MWAWGHRDPGWDGTRKSFQISSLLSDIYLATLPQYISNVRNPNLAF